MGPGDRKQGGGSERADGSTDHWRRLMSAQTFGVRGHPAVLLVPDTGDAPQPWPDELCQRLAAGARFVIRYEPRGTERSSGDERGARRPPLTIWRPTRCRYSTASTCRSPTSSVTRATRSSRLWRATLPTGSRRSPWSPRVRAGTSRAASPSRCSPSDDHDDVVAAILQHTSGGWDAQASRLAAQFVASGNPTGWFDALYSAARHNEVAMPWDREAPQWMLAQWAENNARRRRGPQRSRGRLWARGGRGVRVGTRVSGGGLRRGPERDRHRP